jgi:TPR repeat protein
MPRDDAAAVAWWRAAAARQDIAAAFWLGEAALAGRGGPVDPVDAQAHHAMAAARRHVPAMMRAARSLEQGIGGGSPAAGCGTALAGAACSTARRAVDLKRMACR